MSSPKRPKVDESPSEPKPQIIHQHLMVADKQLDIPPNVEKIIPELIDASVQVKSHSYSPYSKFRVGAALLTKGGQIYRGCNVENASYGLSVCAEVCAYVKAVSDGHREFRAIAVTTDMTENFATPCGACRQFISEFGDCLIIVSRADKQYRVCTIEELLPYSFSPADLKKKRAQHYTIQH